MSFDSHLLRVLEASVSLVNSVVAGAAQGRPFTGASGHETAAAVREALGDGAGDRPTVDATEAEVLADTAEHLHEVFVLADGGDFQAAAEVVNALMRRFQARPQLDADDRSETGLQLHFHGADDGLAVGWSAGMAAGLAAVLGSDLAGRIGVCAAPACDRVYVDNSRNNQKRFCSTACQNRVKTAAFRSRIKSG
jgi:predicted RNA-binding Zn ribbon-like protein